MNNIFAFTAGYIKAKIDNKRYTPDTRPEKYAGKNRLSLQGGNDYLYSLLTGDKPFMAARYGSGELSIARWRLAQRFGLIKNFNEPNMSAICNNAGFFPRDQKMVSEFGDLILEKSSQVDLLGVFYWLMEDYVIKNFAPQAKLVRARGLEPWYVDNPWSRGLEGKKVLLIHPFTSTIIKQYEKQELLFPGKQILPKFDIKTLKAVQTIAGTNDDRFNNWFEALEYMHDEAMKIDFEVAVIGCGAYGFPLAAMLKESGKKAIHLGGATQYLFGIKSKRADETNPLIRGLYNDAWVRPSTEERPKNADSVEGGCYW